jgi:hypothetical protein
VVHISWNRSGWETTDLRVESPSKEKWLKIADIYYARNYNFDDKTKKQWQWLRGHHEWLRDNCPPELREGAHLLFDHHAFMGEDIYVVDRYIQHTMHVYCADCLQPNMVWRNQWNPDKSTHHTECATCGCTKKSLSYEDAYPEKHAAFMKSLRPMEEK